MSGSAFQQKIDRVRQDKPWYKVGEGRQPGCLDKPDRGEQQVIKPRDPYGA